MLESLIAVAQSQMAAILARGANLDAQALGLIGFDAVLVAANLAAQQPLGHLWWAPVPGLALSIAVGASVMAVTRFDLGPSPRDFYARNAHNQPNVALRALLADLLASQERNAALLRLKTGRLIAALVVLLVTIMYSAFALSLP